MTADNNKGITNISYNHLNLPIKITFGTTGSIEYLYNATGQKVSKMVNNGSIGIVTDYLDGYQYLKDASEVELTFFPHAEGYVKHTKDSNNNSRYDYVFNYTDHLGNVRLSYSKDPITELLTVLEENNYYPYGLKHKNYNIAKKQYEMSNPNPELVPCNNCDYKYRYNGQEWQDELGLNFYDYGARNYDPAIGRWMNIDPLAELGRRLSPYNYAMNNPVYFIDPDGMLSQSFLDKISKSASGTVWTNNDDGTFTSNDGEIIFEGSNGGNGGNEENEENGEKPKKTTSVVVETSKYSTKTLTTFTHADFIEYYIKEKKSLENIIENLDNLAILGGGKGIIEMLKDLLKGEVKYSWVTLAMIDVIATSQDLKNRLEKLNDVKDAYDRLHKSNPTTGYGVYMIYVRANIPVSGGTGVQMHNFVDIYSGKPLGIVD